MGMRKTFEEALKHAFAERADDFSGDLKEMLCAMWSDGVRTGLYLEREDLEVPEEVLDAPERVVGERNVEEVRRQPGKTAELETEVERLVEFAEEVALEIERRADPGPTLAMKGTELIKGRHRFLQQLEQIRRKLNEARTLARNFRIHSH